MNDPFRKELVVWMNKIRRSESDRISELRITYVNQGKNNEQYIPDHLLTIVLTSEFYSESYSDIQT